MAEEGAVEGKRTEEEAAAESTAEETEAAAGKRCCFESRWIFTCAVETGGVVLCVYM